MNVKIISEVYKNGNLMFSATESEGKNSLDYYPETTVILQGKKTTVKLGKTSFNAKTQEFILRWYVI